MAPTLGLPITCSEAPSAHAFELEDLGIIFTNKFFACTDSVGVVQDLQLYVALLKQQYIMGFCIPLFALPIFL